VHDVGARIGVELLVQSVRAYFPFLLSSKYPGEGPFGHVERCIFFYDGFGDGLGNCRLRVLLGENGAGLACII
jgi:hypothetical protein